MKKVLLLVLFVLTTVGLVNAQVNGDFRSRVTGNWNVAGNWERYNGSTWATSTVIPASSAANNGNVTIQDGHTITLTAATSVGVTSLTVGQGGGTAAQFTVGGFAITIAGSTTIASNGTILFNSATATKTFTGDVTNNGTWNETAATAISFGGNLVQNGTFTASTGVHTFSGATKTISGSATSISIPSLAATSLTNNIPTLTVGTALTGTLFTLGNSTTLNIGGTSTVTTLNCTTNAPTYVVYNGTGAQTIKATTYDYLTINKSTNTATSSGTTTVNQNLDITLGTFAITGGTFSLYGDFTNSGTLSATGGTFALVGTQSINLDPNTHTVSGTLQINKTSGATVSLTGPLNIAGTLTLTSGVVNTDATNILSITNTAAAGLTTGSATSYIYGPMRRSFPASLSAAATYLFPIGRADYTPFEMVNPTTPAGSALVVTAEVFDSNIGGTDGLFFNSSPNPNRYWITSVSGTGSFTSPGLIELTDPAMSITSANAIGYSTNAVTFNNIGGTAVSSTVLMSSSAPSNTLGYFKIGSKDCINAGTYTVGPTGNFANLTAVASALNSAIICGDVIFEFQSTYNGTSGETFPIVFNEFSYSGGPYSVTIRPEAGATALTTAGAPAANLPLISLNGTDGLILDGRPGGTGTTIQWTIRSTQATGSQTILFNNDATNNIIQYVQVEGVNSTTLSTTVWGNGGVIAFGNTGTSGNSGNVINNCTIKDGATTPYCGIYSIGASGRNNTNTITNCNIYNMWGTGSSAYGILVGSYNTAWKIRGNSVYQTASRTGGSGTHYGIYVGAATGSGTDCAIDGNYIGGGAPQCGGSVWTKTGTTSTPFIGIYSDGGTGGLDTIVNNKVQNIAWYCGSNSTSSAPGIFSGIYRLNGGIYINNNFVGDTTGTGSITVVSSTTGPVCYGIARAASSGTTTITNNYIGSLNINGSASTLSNGFVGISTGQGGSSETRTITGNVIGSRSTANSINLSTSSSTTAQPFRGIEIASGANAATISNNVVANVINSYTSTGTTGQTYGIYLPFGVLTVTGNEVYNITTTSTLTGTSNSASIIGIEASSTSGNTNVSGNKVYNITNTTASAAVHVIGMVISTNTSTASLSTVDANFIHSISSSTSSTTATLQGLHIKGGNNNVTNNMIRLGIDAAGSSLTQGKLTYGIYDTDVATSYSDFYFNSVYIGGSGVASGTISSYAFYSLESAGTRAFQNNIFYNARSNASGTGKNYAFYTASATGLTCSYNDLFVDGTGGIVAAIAAADYATLGAAPGTINGNSISADPLFTAPTGNAATVDLHIPPSASTPIEGVGLNIAAVSADYDGEARASFTPEDLGADAANFTPIDQTAPTITVTPVTQACNGATSATFTATITDASGVEVSAGVAPRVYFKKSTDANDNTGWKYYESTTGSSPFSFTIDFTQLNAGSVDPGDVIQYFVVAQDEGPNVPSPNVAISSGTFAAAQSSVALASGAFPIGGSPTQFNVLPCSGTVTVGTGGDYTSLTNSGGIFEALNATTLSGSLTVNIISNLTTETGSVALNQISESGVGGYTVTIQSGTGGQVQILSTAAATTGLIKYNGADRIVFNGGTGTQRYLLIQNSVVNTGASTISFSNDAQSNTFNNCIIEGSVNSGANGVINFGASAASGVGNDNNTITYCDIRGYNTNIPYNGIYAAGTAGRENSGNTISYNNISNYFNPTAMGAGVFISTGNTAWAIQNNRLFQSATRTYTSTTQPSISAIYVNNSSSNNWNISNNVIGSSDENGTGTMTYTYSSTNSPQFAPIYMLTGSGTASTIQNNTIENISFSTVSAGTADQGTFSGIFVRGTSASYTISGNTIGAATGTGSIAVTIATNSGGYVNGIKNDATGVVNINTNTISGINATATGTNGGAFIFGINSTAGTVTISGNTIGSSSTANSMQTSGNVTAGTNTANITGIYVLSSTAPAVTNNNIYNLTNTNTGTNVYARGIEGSSGGSYNFSGNTIRNLTSYGVGSTNNTASVVGIIMAGSTLQTVTNNTVYGLANAGSGSATVTGIYFAGTSGTVSRNFVHSFSPSSGASSSLIGIHLNGTSTNVNNMVRLGIKEDGSDVTTAATITGILKSTTTVNNIYFNTVFIGGTAASGALHSYAFNRSGASGADLIQNNIFANDRSGGTGLHLAVCFNTLGSLTTSGLDYNVYYSKNNTEFSVVATPANLSAAATPALRLQAFRANTTSGHDLHSGIGTLALLNFTNATGNATAVDLRLGNANCVAGAGLTVSGVTSDIDNSVTRANPPAIGAHESASFNALNATTDIFTPILSTPTVADLSSACGTLTLSTSATITDVGTGVSGSVVPVLWYKNNTAGGAWTAVNAGSPTGNVYPFTTTVTGSASDQFYFYIAAQDGATSPNNWYSHFNATTPAHTAANVASSPAPTAGAYGTFIISASVPLTGTVYVGGTMGGGETLGVNFFNTLTGSSATNDLFAAINSKGISGDLTVLIRANLTETGSTSLNHIAEYCSTGYKVLIAPETASLKTISGSLQGQGLVTFSGADRVTIDGRYNQTGTTRYLKFANTYASSAGSENSTIKFINGALNDTVRYCDIEGASTKAAGGAVHLSSTSQDIVIEENLIHGHSSNWIVNCILADGGASNITIKNNNIYDFLAWSGGSTTRAHGIRVNSGNGSNWTITGNSIYNNGINGQSTQTAISFQPGSSSNNNTISSNWIGGSSPQCGTAGTNATYWGNSWDNFASGENQLYAINVNCGTITLDGNNITNIYLSNFDYSGFIGMNFAGSTVPTVTNNVFGTGSGGTPSNATMIQVAGGGLGGGFYPGYIYGIWNQSTSTSMATYSNNDFYYLFQSGASTGGNVHCISHQSAGPATITGNRINGPQATGRGWNSFGFRVEPTASTSGNVITGNIVAGPYINSLVNGGGTTNSAIYVKMLSTYTVSGTIAKNIVWDMRNADRSGYTEGIYIWTSTGGNGNWNINNNMITLRNNNSTSNCVGLYGIDVELNSSSTTNIYNNTVLIGGSNGGTAVTGVDFSSYGYFRFPNASGSVTGDAVSLRNNIFINTREVSNGYVTGHFAIANLGSATNWNSSNYNFLATGLGGLSYIGYWGGSVRSTFSDWKTASGGDANSWSVATALSGASTATALNPADLFTNILSDLTIKTDNQACWFVNGKGVAGSQVGNLADDIGSAARTTTYGYGIDIGCDEFNASVAPYTLTQSVSGPSTTNTFTFAGRTIGSVNWQASGTTPSTVSMVYYSGNDPGTVGTAYLASNKANFVYEITASGGSGYNYAANLNYDPALLGTYANSESTMRLVKTRNNWFDEHASLNTSTKVLTSNNALNSFSWFTGGEANEPLPITLVTFTAKPNGDHVDLHWVTASEVNNDYFTVERSRNGQTFEPIAVVDGAGNSNTLLTYDEVDPTPYQGLSYYRLKQTDFDGQFDYSNIVPVMFGNDAFSVVNAFTNPANQFEVWINTPADDKADITIIDMHGKLIGSVSKPLGKGMNTVVLPTEGFAAGVYFVRIQTTTNNTSVKLFKQ